jgi:cobalt-zinc-cadmium efflux system protein
MSAHHHHHHHHGLTRERVLWAAVALTFGFMVVEFVAGWYAHSLALMADAAHMLTDAGALGLALFALRWSQRHADSERHYGYGRLQVLAAFVSGLVVLGLAAFLSARAVRRFWHPVEVHEQAMLWVAGVGLVINIVLWLMLRQTDKKSVNMRAASLHVLFDLLSSVAVIASALIIMATGWNLFDAVATFLVSLLIANGAREIIYESGHILLEGRPKGLDMAEVAATIRAAHPAIKNAHKLHAWSLSGEDTLLTVHISRAEATAADDVLKAVKQALADRFHIHHTTLQLEGATCSDL